MKRWSLDARSEGQSGDSLGKTGRSLIKGKDIGDARRWDYSIYPPESAISSLVCGLGQVVAVDSPQQIVELD
jgi:hypothetical protein